MGFVATNGQGALDGIYAPQKPNPSRSHHIVKAAESVDDQSMFFRHDLTARVKYGSDEGHEDREPDDDSNYLQDQHMLHTSAWSYVLKNPAMSGLNHAKGLRLTSIPRRTK